MNAVILMRLCMLILFCLIKYSESNSNTVQVPFNMALSFGKKMAKDGTTAGLGNILRLSTNTTTKTNTDTAATKRNINLSVMVNRGALPCSIVLLVSALLFHHSTV